MADKKTNNNTAEGFLGSVFKYSISTFVNMGIIGLAMLLTAWFVPRGVHNQISLFTSWTGTIMTVAILGLDQSLIRFYNEPPKGLSKNGLFRVCFYFSGAVLLVAGAVAGLFFAQPLHAALGFRAVGLWAVPLLFLNAFFYMVARYFNVLYRMEGNIAVYTVESILMQFFYKLFYVAGVFVGGDNPVPVMVLFSVVGLGGFALVFSFLRRAALRPRLGEFSRANYKAVLPYGLAIAPTAVLVIANSSVAQSYLTNTLGEDPTGIYAYAYSLSNIVTMVQGGFASFWGPYMFENYKTQQARIKRVHNYLNLVILCFFALLVAFEDIIFLILPAYAAVQPIFPLMMLSAVFTILCETTVYGNAIARKPIFDTLGFVLAFVGNITFLVLLTPCFGLYGAAAAIALANFVMFLFRTITGQKMYSSIPSIPKTAFAVLLAVGVAAAGTVFSGSFFIRLGLCAAAVLIYILLYRAEFIHLVKIVFSTLKSWTAPKGR